MDAPGPYVVVHKSLVVTASAARNSGLVARLQKGAAISVLEAQVQDGGQKVRGCLKEPAGWVTLVDHDRGIRGAAPADSDAAAAALAAPPATAPPSPAAVPAPAAGSSHPASPSGVAGPSPSSAPSGPATAAAAAPAGAARGATRAVERMRQLEAELREVESRTEDQQAALEAMRTRCSELQARWADMSGSSDDALQAADGAKRRAAVLRRAVEEKGSRLDALRQELEQLAADKECAEREHAELEAAFRERLAGELGEKEQRLQEERALLKQLGEQAERRVRELAGEKSFLEQRVLARGASGAAAGEGSGGGKHEAMLEAHMSIAHAFGGLALEHPCLRLADEPALKLTVVLLKQPLVRRGFFGFTACIWFFAIRCALLQQGGAPAIHV